MPDSRNRLFEITRARNLYEAAACRKSGKMFRKFSLDLTTKRGSFNYKYLGLIVDLVATHGIPIEEYFTAMIEWWKSVDGKDVPRLQYLATENSVASYKRRMATLGRLFVTNKAAKTLVAAKSAVLHEAKFVNCFYNGFKILQGSGPLIIYERSALELFTLFLAYVETFTPEFEVTHTRFGELVRFSPATSEAKEVKKAILEHVQPAQIELDRHPIVYNELMRTRKKVEEREKKTLNDLVGLAGRNNRVWRLLI